MLTPPNKTFIIPPGGTLRVGQVAPSAVPAWVASAPINEWRAIANTSGAGGASIDAFSGGTLNEATSEFIIALAGGHGATLDNRVVGINLMADAPAWTVRKAASTTTSNDTTHYPDGTPASRHTYAGGIMCNERNRLMIFGMYGGYPNAVSSLKVDGFNLDTNTWDAAGTWPDIASPGIFYPLCEGANGDVWISNGARWNQGANNYTSFTWGASGRFPAAFDSLRSQVFMLQFGDGQGFNPELGLRAFMLSASGVQTTITFNASSALTALTADAPAYSAMQYEPNRDEFWFYPGAKYTGSGNIPHPNPEKVYVVKPNSGSVWDVSALTLGSGTQIPSATPAGGAGINARFKYVPALKGMLLLPQASSNCYFMRTSL